MHYPENFSIVLLGENTLIREGLCRILAEARFEIIVSSPSLRSINNRSQLASPNLIVVDWRETDDVAAALLELKEAYPEARIVILVDEFSYDGMTRAFGSGVDGYIVKRLGCESLVASLRLAAMGEKVFPSQLVNQLGEVVINHPLSANSTSDLTELLSDRELETMRYLLGGNPNKVIANNLEVSEATVKVHVKSILRKLGVRNRTQAAIWAVNNGLEYASSCYGNDDAGVVNVAPAVGA